MNTQTPLGIPSEILDQRALAALLGVPYRTLRRHVTAQSPHLPPPSGRVGQAYVWRRADIDPEAIRAAWPRVGRPPKRRATAA